MQKLKQAIQTTGLSNTELSLKLGHNKKYITNLLLRGCSTALQNQLINEINQVMNGTFKSDAEVIAELSEKLAKAQDILQHNANCAHNYLEQWKHEQKLKRESDELNASLINTNKQLMEESDANHNLATDLLATIKQMHQTAQNDAETIETLKAYTKYLLTKYERQKRNSAILGLLLFIVITVLVWSHV